MPSNVMLEKRSGGDYFKFDFKNQKKTVPIPIETKHTPPRNQIVDPLIEDTAICEEFSKWQVVVFKNYGVPEDAEILAESAFRQFIPSFMAGKSMLELWEHLAFEHWSKINRFRKVTFANWQKKIATTQMRWREHLDACQPHREFGVQNE